MGERFGSGPEDFAQAGWLSERLDAKWRFDHTAGRWHHWDGSHWAPDKKKQVLKAVANEVMKAVMAGEGDNKVLVKLLSVSPQAKALEALSTLDGYGTDGDDWDTDPYLLGVKNGIVDLRENALVAHPDPSMLVTRTTNTDFVPMQSAAEATKRAPVFMRVLREWMDGDEDMMWFLLFWFGASLFGFTPEEKFLLMTGIGRNGKGALKEAVMFACGEYAEELDKGLYMRNRFGEARSSDARADLLKLKGVRIAFFSEPHGGQFNEELLKAHTGGDRIAARALYSNNIQTWDPTHSISFLTNNLPTVEDVGPSMGERVMVTDFNNIYEGPNMDTSLKGKGGKLWREREGILAILVWAASIWYQRWSAEKGGLVLPERVKEQSRAFIERNDPIAQWMDERCERGQELSVASAIAYENYLSWHRTSDDPNEAMSQVRWGSALLKKGYRKVKKESGMRWLGFKVMSAVQLAENGVDEDEDP